MADDTAAKIRQTLCDLLKLFGAREREHLEAAHQAQERSFSDGYDLGFERGQEDHEGACAQLATEAFTAGFRLGYSSAQRENSKATTPTADRLAWLAILDGQRALAELGEATMQGWLDHLDEALADGKAQTH